MTHTRTTARAALLAGALASSACAGEAGSGGPTGPTGPTGPAGSTGPDGADGVDGRDGVDGQPFAFRRDPPSAYTRVDRMGMPAVATAVVSAREAYNDADPADDATLDPVSGLPRFVASDIVPALTSLHGALRDDLVALGLTPCATDAGGALPCVTQPLFPGGPEVLGLVVPDTLRIDPSEPAGFPNGRRLQDPVIDVTLGVLLLDLTRHPATALAALPLNPPGNDLPFLTRFPYLAFPHRP